jgi:uncharacterized membrane protein YedE/YeeE
MTPELWMAILGGLLIGLGSVVLLSLAGRVAGVSGILWGALTAQATHLWRWLFLAGLIGGAALAHKFAGAPLPQPSALPSSMALLGGLLVGIGVRLGNGCTSGHGVCGIGLNSGRSTVATVTFMLTGIATVFIIRHAMGWFA